MKRVLTIIAATAVTLLASVSCKKEKYEPLYDNYWLIPGIGSEISIYKFNRNQTLQAGVMMDKNFLESLKSEIKDTPEKYRESQRNAISEMKVNDWTGETYEITITLADPQESDPTPIIFQSAKSLGITVGKMHPLSAIETPKFLSENIWLSKSIATGLAEYGFLRYEYGRIYTGSVVNTYLKNSLYQNIRSNPDKYPAEAQDIVSKLVENDLLQEQTYTAVVIEDDNISGTISVRELNIENASYKATEKYLRIYNGETVIAEFASTDSLGIKTGEEYFNCFLLPKSNN